MPRRPFVWIASGFIVGIAAEAVSRGWSDLSFMILGGFSIFFIVVFREKKSKKKFSIKWALVILVCILAGALFYSLENQRSFQLHEVEGEIRTVWGRILFVEERQGGRQYLTLICYGEEERGAFSRPEKVIYRIYDGKDSLVGASGKVVQCKGEVKIPESARNPACFDYREYLRTRDVGTIMDGKRSWIYFPENNGGGVFSQIVYGGINKVACLKQEFLHRLKDLLTPRQFSLALGMLFGDKTQMEEPLIELFQKNATAHILAVSGLHVGIFYLFFLSIGSWTGWEYSLVWNGLILFLLLNYAFLSAFSPSVVRAVLMIGFHILCRFLHVRFDLLSATLLTASLVLLFQPFMIHNVGFQLSYMALLSMAFFVPLFERCFKFFAIKILGPLLAIQIGLTPLIVHHFNHVSLVSILANIPSVLLAGLVLPVLLFLFPLSFLGQGVFFVTLGKATGWGLDGLVFVNRLLFWEGKTSFWVIGPPVFLVAGMLVVIFFISSEEARILRIRGGCFKGTAACLCILIFALTAQGIYKKPLENCDMVFLDVGQGDCLFIETPKGRTIMIDSGGSDFYDVGRKVLLPYLLKNGHGSIDLAVVTHLHQDHYGGFQTLSQELPVHKLVLYEGYRMVEEEIISSSGFQRNQLVYVSKGTEIIVEEGVRIVVLSPESFPVENTRLPEDENQISLVLRVECKGVSLLMTGDIDQKGEEVLLIEYQGDSLLHHDILKIAHHGSRFSTGQRFLKEIDPVLAVIQVGKNNFGHPHPTVIEKCLEQDIMVLRNDLSGAIGIGIPRDGNKQLWIETMLSSE